MKKTKLINPIIAERLFIVAIVALIILMTANFIFATQLLTTQSRQADHAKIEAEVSSNDIKTMAAVGKKIDSDPDAVKRAQSIVANSQLYQYQDQIINDLQGYAARSGTAIVGYSFTTTDPAASAATTPPPTAPATGTTPAITAPIQVTPAGVTSTTVSLTLQSSVGYVNFLNLLKLIESNVTQMQVTDISLAPDIQNRAVLASPTLSIMVYTR